ncbi:hypothetical protein BHE74_00056881 [Ensete ventricosum]|nr:hypothetical protein BHE74_00056881 [Ensete ventricosum]
MGERCGGEEEGECCSKSSKGDKTRRFSEEQIRSLESAFEAQTKLEARQKQQLAREIGLQPRQVAIWFQNKRARWRSKQLDGEYRALRADYHALLSHFDSLNKEKQLLLKQKKKKRRRQDVELLLRGRTRPARRTTGNRLLAFVGRETTSFRHRPGRSPDAQQQLTVVGVLASQ